MNYMLHCQTDTVPVLSTGVYLSRYGALLKNYQYFMSGMSYITYKVIT